MVLFFVAISLSAGPSVTYSSVIQLKSLYSKNRLAITIDLPDRTSGSPSVFSSRPPFDDGWLWMVESSEVNTSFTRKPVRCGDLVTLSNPIVGLYLATRATSKAVEVVPAPYTRGAADYWTVICRDPPIWVQDAQIQLKNAKHGCYLGTGIKNRARETVNKFNVTCGPLSAGAVWGAVEGVYFSEESDSV
jgi:hypothetical protein